MSFLLRELGRRSGGGKIRVTDVLAINDPVQLPVGVHRIIIESGVVEGGGAFTRKRIVREAEFGSNVFEADSR